MEKISVIGIGKLGLCLALNLERKGYDVVGYDINAEYAASVDSKMHYSHEPSVNDYLRSAINFKATNSLREAVNHSDMLFVVVATPSLPTGKYNHSQVDSVVSELETYGIQKSTKNLIICCTTMPGYTESLSERLGKINFTVSYNPEFIAQGSIIKDQLNPDMILIGEASKEVGDAIQKVYETLCDSKPEFHRMTPTAAELTKISLNCFITTKIAYANMIGDMCNKLNVDYRKVLGAIGSDSRVGKKYLGYGYGYGGPCFPRDNRVLSIVGDEIGINAIISKSSDASNALHLKYQLKEAFERIDKATALKLGPVSFKPGVPSIEESQQLQFAVGLAKNGYNVTVVDTEAVISQVKELYGDLFKYEKL